MPTVATNQYEDAYLRLLMEQRNGESSQRVGEFTLLLSTFNPDGERIFMDWLGHNHFNFTIRHREISIICHSNERNIIEHAFEVIRRGTRGPEGSSIGWQRDYGASILDPLSR